MPVAVNCCVWPARIVGLLGETVMEGACATGYADVNASAIRLVARAVRLRPVLVIDFSLRTDGHHTYRGAYCVRRFVNRRSHGEGQPRIRSSAGLRYRSEVWLWLNRQSDT